MVSVHPRWRGEQARITGAPRFSIGSSPLARGTAGHGRARRNAGRFIPAGAGNSTRMPRCSITWTVHPRWRGEQSWRGCCWRGGLGSSPLARGTVAHGRFFFRIRRFIPAGAGNSGRVVPDQRHAAVHPRWRGEQDAAPIWSDVTTGSSPLARGTGAAEANERAQARFIPAGAGNSRTVRERSWWSPVHPRWRGEQQRG